jgi:hypothetical protein
MVWLKGYSKGTAGTGAALVAEGGWGVLFQRLIATEKSNHENTAFVAVFYLIVD